MKIFYAKLARVVLLLISRLKELRNYNRTKIVSVTEKLESFELVFFKINLHFGTFN